MYVVLDKEEPGIGDVKDLNLEAVSPVAVQLTNCSCRVVT
jgi:hypothetical protein